MSEIKNPDGALLPADSILIVGGPQVTIPAQGAAVPLRVMSPERFAAAGDYGIRLLASSPTGPGAQALSLTVHRDTATLDTERLAEFVLPVTLGVWGGDGRSRFTLPLVNTSKTAVRDLSIVVQPLRLKAKKELVPDSSVTRFDKQLVKARGQLDLSFAVPLPDRSGSFQTSVDLRSPSLGATAPITLTIEVSHHWLWAMLVIFGGVLAGFLVNLFTKKWRPTQQLRLQLLKARSELQRIENLLEDVGKRQLCASIRELLQQAELQSGEPTVARDLRVQAEQKLDELRKAWCADLDAASTLHRELGQRLGALRGQGTARPEVAKELERAEQHMAEISSLLVQRRADAARARLREVEALVSKLEPAPAPGGSGGVLTAFDDASAPAPAPRGPRFTLRVPEPGERCVVHTELVFTVEDSRAELERPTAYEWSFGTPSGRHSATTPEARYTYQDAGAYWVTVLIRLPDGTQEISRKLTVHPSREQRDLAAAGWLLARADLVMSVLSLFVATGSGLIQLYLNGPFGTPEQYFGAFLWGLGIDSSVRGAAAVLQRLSGES